MARRLRLDAELVRRSLARSRADAAELIDVGRVQVDGFIATKASTQVDPAQAVHVIGAESEPTYVSRGARKLTSALDILGDQAPLIAGVDALDAGASTGGFTDVLLRRGVNRVIAVDVGYGQLAWSISQDPRVFQMDRTNVRTLAPADLPYCPGLIVGDLSFISLTLVLPALRGVLAPGGAMLLMVKPQFEVGKENVGPSGVVTSPTLRAWAVAKVIREARRQGLVLLAVAASGLPGPKGNVEFFVHLSAGEGGLDELEVAAAVAAATGAETKELA